MIEGVSSLLEGKDTEGDGLDDFDGPQNSRDRWVRLTHLALLWTYISEIRVPIFSGRRETLIFLALPIRSVTNREFGGNPEMAVHVLQYLTLHTCYRRFPRTISSSSNNTKYSKQQTPSGTLSTTMPRRRRGASGRAPVEGRASRRPERARAIGREVVVGAISDLEGHLARKVKPQRRPRPEEPRNYRAGDSERRCALVDMVDHYVPCSVVPSHAW